MAQHYVLGGESVFRRLLPDCRGCGFAERASREARVALVCCYLSRTRHIFFLSAKGGCERPLRF